MLAGEVQGRRQAEGGNIVQRISGAVELVVQQPRSWLRRIDKHVRRRGVPMAGHLQRIPYRPV